ISLNPKPNSSTSISFSVLVPSSIGSQNPIWSRENSSNGLVLSLQVRADEPISYYWIRPKASQGNLWNSRNNATTSTDGVDTNCYEEQNTELNDNEILNDAAIEHTDNVVITEVANEADRSRSCEPTANDSSREPAP
ncbi:hypothetical protein Csa_009785, partial [Cucumis sativus]